MLASGKTRSSWQDRFKTPTIDQLVGELNRQNAAVIEHARDRLSSGAGLSEELRWQGVWRWTMLYRAPSDNGLASIYVVPDPTKLRMAVLMPEDRIAELPLKKLSKFIRDGLLHAPVVDGLRWAQWEVQTKSQVDEVLALAAMRAVPTA